MTPAMERGLPCNPDAERFILGWLLLDGDQFGLVAGTLEADDFSIEKHRRIFSRMGEVFQRGEHVDYLTVHTELQRRGESEACDGLSYLTDLTDGVPQIRNVDSHVQMLRDKATLRRTIFTCQNIMNRCMEDRSGSADILADAEAFMARLADGQQKHGHWLNPGQVIANYPGGLNAFMAPPRGGAGIPTPWPKITADLCGLHRGDLVLVAGRPSMGKSIVGMQLAHCAAARNEGVAVFSLEMSKESLIRRLISAVGDVDAQRLRIGCLDREERGRANHAAAEIDAIPLYIDDTRARTMPAVTSALRKLIARHSIRLVIVDHLQLMKGIGRSESRHHELSDISHSLKHLAGELDVTVVLLSQLNRDCERETRPPRLSDLKETGSLEEDADVVLFVHRPEQYKRNDPSLRGKAEFIIGKQRNGPTGRRHMLFQHPYQRFVETTQVGEYEGDE